MNEKKERPTFEFHFHEKVGQNIANVEQMTVCFDKDMQMQVMNAEQITAGEMSAPMAFQSALKTMIDEGTICQISDLCHIYRVDNEMGAVGFLSIPDFLRRLEKLCDECSRKDLFPNVNNFKNYSYGTKDFPDWPWNNFAPSAIPHIKAVCNAYIRLMSNHGFRHSSCTK